MTALERRGLSGNRWRAMASSWASVHRDGPQNVVVDAQMSTGPSGCRQGRLDLDRAV